MNSRLDWLVLSDYYSIYVISVPPSKTRLNFYGSDGFFHGFCFFARTGTFPLPRHRPDNRPSEARASPAIPFESA